MINVQYDCVAAPLEFTNVQYAWWNDRNGNARYFWAGNNASSEHTCRCGLDHNCVEPGRIKCNCDSVAAIALYDEGIIGLYKLSIKSGIDCLCYGRRGDWHQGIVTRDSLELRPHPTGEFERPAQTGPSAVLRSHASDHDAHLLSGSLARRSRFERHLLGERRDTGGERLLRLCQTARRSRYSPLLQSRSSCDVKSYRMMEQASRLGSEWSA